MKFIRTNDGDWININGIERFYVERDFTKQDVFCIFAERNEMNWIIAKFGEYYTATQAINAMMNNINVD